MKAVGTGSQIQAVAAVLFAALAVAHVVLTRLSWSGTPLQTDAGIWAYFGSRILDGALLYRDLWDNKPPGIFYAFAATEWLFGTGHDRALLWLDAVLGLAVFAVTYRVARRFASPAASAAAILPLSLVFCHRILADWGDNAEKFVALFEMTACSLAISALCGTAALGCDRAATCRWALVGLCCGCAGTFKQTGILFLMAAIIAVLCWKSSPLVSEGRRGLPNECDAQRSRWKLRSIVLMCLGALVPWLFVGLGMLNSGNFDDFWRQAVEYDLARVGSSGGERSRLLDAAHWNQFLDTIELASILFAPACLALLVWAIQSARRRTRGDRTQPRPAQAPSDPNAEPALLLVVIYAILTVAVFPIAPYGYGHYLLQAAPPAAVLVAWFFDRMLRGSVNLIAPIITAVVVLAASGTLSDHLQFTLSQRYQFREAYANIARNTARQVEIAKAYSAPGESVMIWPTNHAVSYYADRRTPLEVAHSIDIFQGKILQMDPPMDELLRRIQADPPALIVDSTDLRVVQQTAPAGETRKKLEVEPAFSFSAPPNDEHKTLEGRLLAPLKRWIRENYGGQKRVGECTLFFRGQPWREWRKFMLENDGRRKGRSPGATASKS